MNLAQLRVFNAVAIHGSFSAAAQALGVSQPAVTQHVKALEETAGARLFNRLNGRVELTADALDLWPMVRQTMLMLEEIGRRLEGGQALTAGHLSLGLCAPHLAMPAIRRFREAFPAIRVGVQIANSSRLLDLVADHAVDLAFVTLREPRPGYVCERLVDQTVLVLTPADHPWRDRERIDVGELRGAAFVGRERGSMTRRLFEEGLAGAGVSPVEVMTLESREAMKEAVAAGLGLGYVLDHELGHDPRLHALRVDGADMRATEYLVTTEAVAAIGSVREFIALTRDLFG